MKPAEAQALVKDCLLANSLFAALPIFTELDPQASPDQLAAMDTAFETALATCGIALIILSPHALALGQVKSRGGAAVGGISLELVVPVAICENPEVNRGTADPAATPPRAPAGLLPLELLEAGISALCTKFSFPAQPFGRPEFADGFCAYYLMPQRQHTILSA